MCFFSVREVLVVTKAGLTKNTVNIEHNTSVKKAVVTFAPVALLDDTPQLWRKHTHTDVTEHCFHHSLLTLGFLCRLTNPEQLSQKVGFM